MFDGMPSLQPPEVVFYGVAKLVVAATEAEEDAEDQGRSSVVCMRHTTTVGCTVADLCQLSCYPFDLSLIHI